MTLNPKIGVPKSRNRVKTLKIHLKTLKTCLNLNILGLQDYFEDVNQGPKTFSDRFVAQSEPHEPHKSN